MAKILLADDSTHAQRMGAKILTAEGHQVSTVSNGQAAIHSLEQGVPELVIADVFMPGRNGYEVCHFVKSDDKLKNIPVLLIIGAMEPYDPEEGRRAGADGLITKPLESSSLVGTVNDLLAAAKRFAPTRAAAKQTDSGKILMNEPAEVAVEETPQWDDTPEEIISTVQEQKLEIPEEMNEQPIGMLTDVMRADAASEAAVRKVPIGAPMEVSMVGLETPELEMTEAASMLPDPATLPQLDIAEKTTWSAEPAEMTAEEARLFEQPSANWGDLEQLVEQTAAEQPAPAPLPWQTPEPAADATAELLETGRDPGLETREDVDVPIEADPLLYRPPEISADIPEDPDIEHYESLDAVVEAQGPVAYKASPPPAPEEAAMSEENAGGQEFSGPVEELEASPEERNMPPVEQLVRQAVEELMPEIIDRVKQSLKG